jgi:hypothetical protein
MIAGKNNRTVIEPYLKLTAGLNKRLYAATDKWLRVVPDKHIAGCTDNRRHTQKYRGLAAKPICPVFIQPQVQSKNRLAGGMTIQAIIQTINGFISHKYN